MYWDQDKSTYVLASQSDSATVAPAAVSTPVAAAVIPTPVATVVTPVAASTAAPAQTSEVSDVKDTENKKTDQKHDKVKVAKKIVKDMEKWAKQLNQKKDMNAFHSAPIPAPKEEEVSPVRFQPLQRMAGGYADVGFSILENRESRLKSNLDNHLPAYASDSDNEQSEQQTSVEPNEKDLVDFDKLACLLCKRAFPSLEILNKHLKLSNLHKENLQKINQRTNSANGGNGASGNNSATLSYRDRAKERRLKYGECDPPPPNKSRERFEKELQKHTAQIQKQASSNLASTPIGENNVGNRLLQKMGWTEGQGLGRSNQGRTNIIEVSNSVTFEFLSIIFMDFFPLL